MLFLAAIFCPPVSVLIALASKVPENKHEKETTKADSCYYLQEHLCKTWEANQADGTGHGKQAPMPDFSLSVQTPGPKPLSGASTK